MTDTLEPIHTIPLGPTLTGEVAQAELQFAVENGKPVLYAAVPVWNATWGRWFAWHAPEIMVGVWLVVLIVLVRRLLHVRRTPREAGRRYCRKCNHQLTKPQLAFDERGRVQWASAEAKCPECGVRTRRVPVRGRKGWVRRLPWILLAVPVLLLLPLFVLFSLERFAPTPGTSEPTWPVRDLQHVLGSAALRRDFSAYQTRSRSFWRIDPATGSTLRYPTSPPTNNYGYISGPFVSPAGKRIVAGGAALDEVVVIDTTSRAARSLRRSGVVHRPGYVQFLSFDGDDFAIVQREAFLDGGENLWLERVNLVDGTFETISHVVVPRAHAMYPNINRFDVGVHGGRVSWLLQSAGWQPTGGQRNEVRWPIGDTVQARDLTDPNRTFNHQARLSRDGTAVLITNDRNGEDAFTYDSGESIANPPPTLFEYPRAHPTLDFVFVSNTQMKVVDRQDNQKAYLLPDIGPGGILTIPVIARTDRFVAMNAIRAVPSRWHQILTGKPTRLEGEIRIFRIPDPPEK